MLFMIRETDTGLSAKDTVVLFLDYWNDWYTYTTMYTMFYYDSTGNRKRIGSVKVGEVGMREGRATLLPEFNKLEDNFFSLGQSDEYYSILTSLGGDVRDEILSALRDIAYDNSLYRRFKSELVMYNSLMRNISQTTILGQYHRLANGMSRLSQYDFFYEMKSRYEGGDAINLHLRYILSPSLRPMCMSLSGEMVWGKHIY